MHVLALVVVLAVAGFSAGALLYLGISFGMMRRYVPERAFGATVRALLREALWVTLTQPLLPLYFFVGRKMGGAGRGVPVVLVHGYSQNRANFLYLARTLRRQGLGPLYGFNYNSLREIPTIAHSLEAFVESVAQETGALRVDLVSHSMGGLVAAHSASSEHGQTHVRKCVTIAAPHHGVTWRGPILGSAALMLRAGHGIEMLPALPWLSLYSTHDNVVHPFATSMLDGATIQNLAVGDVGHLAILFDPRTADAVVAFLDEAPCDLDASSSAAPIAAST